MLKEIEVLPDSIRKAGFYFLPPLLVVGTLLLFPYTRARLAIVSPKFLTRSLLIAMIGISVFAATMLATMYVQQAPYGEMDAGAINSAAKLVKGVILAASIGVFGLRGSRLFQWHRRRVNSVVFSFVPRMISAGWVSGGSLPASLGGVPPHATRSVADAAQSH